MMQHQGRQPRHRMYAKRPPDWPRDYREHQAVRLILFRPNLEPIMAIPFGATRLEISLPTDLSGGQDPAQSGRALSLNERDQTVPRADRGDNGLYAGVQTGDLSVSIPPDRLRCAVNGVPAHNLMVGIEARDELRDVVQQCRSTRRVVDRKATQIRERFPLARDEAVEFIHLSHAHDGRMHLPRPL